MQQSQLQDDQVPLSILDLYAASELRGVASQVPRTRSLVDELLRERRRAAAVGE